MGKVVGQVLVVVLLAPVKGQALARPRQHIAAELGAFAGEQVGNIHAQGFGNVEQVGEGEVLLALFIGQVFLQGHAGAAGHFLGAQAADVAQVRNSQGNQLNLVHNHPP